MVFIRRKDVRHWERPPYEANSKYITMTLHFGGEFVGMPTTFYVGGETLVYDWVKADEFRFKFIIDDDDLRTWASKCLKVGRELPIYVELLPGEGKATEDRAKGKGKTKATEDRVKGKGKGKAKTKATEVRGESEVSDEDYESFEDDDNVVGNEILSNDEGDNEVKDVIERDNEDGTEHEEGMREEQNERNGGVEDSDEARGDDERDEVRGDDEKGEGRDVGGDSSESECEVDRENDVIAGDAHDFDEHRVSDEENDEPSYPIRKFNPEHTCAPSSKVRSLTSGWLSRRFIQSFKSDANRSPSTFMEDASYKIRCEVSRQQAHRARNLALVRINGDPDKQYAKLWSYCEEIRKTNPGSTILIGTEVDNGVLSRGALLRVKRLTQRRSLTTQELPGPCPRLCAPLHVRTPYLQGYVGIHIKPSTTRLYLSRGMGFEPGEEHITWGKAQEAPEWLASIAE
ncbi:hypothetical protein ACS0TY_001397 [Phlomoides rotata]